MGKIDRISPAAVMAAVERRMGGPWAWGLADCCSSATAVFADLHGIDLMAGLRGTYRGAGGAARLIRDEGGMMLIADRTAAFHGLRPTAGRPGDIGLVLGGAGFSAAICIQHGVWAAKTTDGFGIASMAVASWGL